MNISEIKTAPPFNELFEIDEGIVEAIAQHMREKGFDPSQPIVLWFGKDIVVDGHTRLEAARQVGLAHVPALERMFRNEAEAIAYAIHNQRNRRNLTEAELLRCIEAVDRVKERGEGQERVEGKFQPKAPSGATGKSAEKTAKMVGVSSRTVDRARTVLSDPEVAQEVKAGKMSINRGAQAVKAKRQAPMTTDPIIGAEDKRQDVLLQAWGELSAWRMKYSQCPEFKDIFWAIDASMEKRQSAGRNQS